MGHADLKPHLLLVSSNYFHITVTFEYLNFMTHTE